MEAALLALLAILCCQVRPSLTDPPISCRVRPAPAPARASPRFSQRLGLREGPQVECSCGEARRDYTGNLNFAKAALSRVTAASLVPGAGGSVDLVIRDCDSLRLELNLHTVAATQPFNLRVSEVARLEISAAEVALAATARQTIVVRDVARVRVAGRLQCRSCEPGGGLLNIQMENVSHFTMENSSVTLPLKLTGRHMEQVTIQDSTFTQLPWPGVFLHNASRVEIVRNMFLSTMPRSISISLGAAITISHNLLDLDALKVEQYERQVVKCNRGSAAVVLPASCSLPLTLEYDTTSSRHEYNDHIATGGRTHAADNGRGPGGVAAVAPVERELLVTALVTVDTLGLVLLAAAALASLVLGLGRCCCRSWARRSAAAQEKTGRGGGGARRPDLLVIPFPGEERDGDSEYSESSRVHLAMGPQLASPGQRLPQWVRVQGVRADPQEDGVVCGSLTLGPSFTSSQAQQQDTDTAATDRTVSSNILKQQAFSKV